MAVCFQLFRKSTGEGPLPLTLVDEEICKEFKAIPHPVRYFKGWFDCVGFGLACGKTYQQIRSQQEDYLRLDLAAGRTDWWMLDVANLSIIRFMEANYMSNSWSQIGK